MLKKLIALIVVLVLLGVTGYWLYSEASKPLPGESVPDLGREHVEDIAGVEYNSNPPTSGKHFPMWAKKGKYDRLISDGYLIHSLEHGYVIVSYDCTKLPTSAFTFIPSVEAHDEPAPEASDSGQLLKHMKLTPTATMSAFSPDNAPDVEVPLPDSFNSQGCKNLENDLSKLLSFKERVIIVPRINMDKAVAVTAWARILKLDNFDQKMLEDFISAFHNKGPEKTVE